MTFDEIIDACATMEEPLEPAFASAEAAWDTDGPRFRALLRGYVDGTDTAERTERAVLAVSALLAQMGDAASFPLFCALGRDPDRLHSALGEDDAAVSLLPMLISTYGGEASPLHALIEDASAEEYARGEGLLLLAYLARSGQMTEAAAYAYLAGLSPRLQPQAEHYVWFAFAQTVAMLGFAGLSGHVEAAISRGLVPPGAMDSAGFWQELRDSAAAPKDLSHPMWDGLGRIDDAAAFLADDQEEDGPPPVSEPVRNPLRDVGRNDPCPCGSGKKYKKCCLA